MKPRRPTTAEKAELIAYLVRTLYVAATDEDRAYEAREVENGAIAVFDDYATDGPGYAGKVLMVVWGGSPSFAQVFTWGAGGIESCEIETGGDEGRGD
jgi:hypothetical protein